MEFTRRGTYDDVPMEAYPYEGQAFPTMKNDASPPLGYETSFADRIRAILNTR